MNYIKLSNTLKRLEKEFDLYLDDFASSKVFQKTNNIYLKEDKIIIVAKWKKIKRIFTKFKKIINSHNSGFFSGDIYNNLIIRHYSTVTYYNMTLKLQETFGGHEDFIRQFLNEKYRENYSTIARFIYYPSFLYYLNYPKEFLNLIEDKIHQDLKWMLKKDINYRIKLDFEYKNFFYYFKYGTDKILYSVTKFLWNILSDIILKPDKKWLITNECIQEFYKFAKAGDILLTRQTYVATNLSIPWFWKHMSMYLWDWEYLQNNFKNEIFKNLSPKNHYIIESTGEWVKIARFEDFIYEKDYLWVFRTTFSQDKIKRAIFETSAMLDKEYDYLFNFHSDSSFVCSELITKGYLKDNDKDEWLTIELQKIASWLTYPPNEFAKKAYNERISPDKEIFGVFFIDSKQKSKTSFVNTIDELLESYKRSRFSFWLK